jgi:hypothetical protein
MLKSNERRVAEAGDLRGARLPRRAMIVAAALMCAASLMMSSVPGIAAGNKAYSAKYWKGRNISEVHKKFGDPTQMTAIQDTGGTMYIYAHHGQQHWVFETDPGGKIVKAAKID